MNLVLNIDEALADGVAALGEPQAAQVKVRTNLIQPRRSQFISAQA